jgi:uncharacterized 2Fe-2S/4Fe-4S cluster protein (DUF4445 family)
MSPFEDLPIKTIDPSLSYTVIFEPSGRRGQVAEGTTLLDAARQLGVAIESICGGRQTCAKCYVRVEEGEFARHGIRSRADHVTAAGERERRYRQLRGVPEAMRYSCDARVTGDVLVTVPAESQGQKQVVLKAARDRAITVDPIIRLYYIELPPPEMDAPGDRERVLAELAARFGLRDLEFDLSALRDLAPALRQISGGAPQQVEDSGVPNLFGHAPEPKRWAITLTVWDDRWIVRVQPGYHERAVGLAVDLGSTTLAAYLCDLRTGALLATASAVNPQVSYGDDIMSRISYAVEQPEGRSRLHGAIIAALNDLAADAARRAGLAPADIVDMTLVGNSVMHHLALDLDPGPLGASPFVPTTKDPVDLRAADLGLKLNPGARLHVLPLEAGYVGADNVGVILAEEPHRQDEVVLIIDVGTNGELLLGNRHKLFCASSPTGPALEGAQITHGMRAAAGAIERVRIDPETLDVRFKVIGGEEWANQQIGKSAPAICNLQSAIRASGICGTGIIEAVAEMFAAGIVEKSGRFNRKLTSPRHTTTAEGSPAFVLAWPEQSATGAAIVVSQADVRAIQLAKAALYVGAQVLLREFGAERVDRVVLAGAFGSVIDPYHTMLIGMIPDCDLRNVTAVGNAAGDGARIALLNKAKRREAAEVARWVRHVSTPLEGDFQKLFMAALAFPHATDAFPHLAAASSRR